MQIMLMRITKELIFWLAWIVIPVLWEITPAVAGFFVLIKKKYMNRRYRNPIKYPEITVIIPVYNSQHTLGPCLESIYNSTYPHDMMTVYVVDNGSSDKSYEVFIECQHKYRDMLIWWMRSGQGKSKALNLALFNSSGKYIIHVDSDGVIEKTAIARMVNKFEEDLDIHSMTGSILIDPRLVEETEDFFLRLTRRCEMFEYFNAFLAGRNYESEFGSMYTLSGAFSAFRKSAILKTFLYNSSTVCEDTHVTFQLRELLKQDVTLCEDALFFVDPIENYDKLYTQRQRWQRGEIEVSHMFLADKLKPHKFFSNFMVRVLMYDHTFAFPRAIWYFAIVYLLFINYPLKLIFGSTLLIYLLYVMVAFLFYLNIRSYLSEYGELKKYYTTQWYICFFYPIYNFAIFFIRFAGIINSIKTDMTWKTRTFSQEMQDFGDVVKKDFKKINQMISKIRKGVSHE